MGTIELRDNPTLVACGGNGQADSRGAEIRDVEALIDDLEVRADSLNPGANNANQVLAASLIIFLASERGCEFGASLRFCTYQRFAAVNERAEELRAELRAIEEQLGARQRVFAFVESLTGRLQHSVSTDS